MFKVTYKYSACILVETNDVRILCDPWFTEAYSGTWGQQQDCEKIRNEIEDYDMIYISHIHPDHYCSDTIKYLNGIHGKKKIIIAKWDERRNYLKRKMKSDEIKNEIIEIDKLTIGETEIRIIRNNTGSHSDIDSALLIADTTTKKSVLNFNDCIGNDNIYEEINKTKRELDVEITLLCLGYTGAGPYPQTYYSPYLEKEQLAKLSKKKKIEFIDRYKKTIEKIRSRKRLPFAGKYKLNGILGTLNEYRGVADAIEIKNYDKDAIVIEDGGKDYYDVISGKTTCERKKPYWKQDMIDTGYVYEWQEKINFLPTDIILRRLLIKSLNNAHKKSECITDNYWTIYVYRNNEELREIWSEEKPWDKRDKIMTFNCNKQTNWSDTKQKPECHSRMFIERKALFAVLTGITHWNNYEVGSVYQVRRIPDIYIPTMQKYLNFLCVI